MAQLRARLAEVGEASAAAAADTAKELTAVVGKLGKARASARCTREHASSRNARPVAFRSTLTALRLCRHARRLTSTFRSTWRAPGGSGPSTKARCSRCVPCTPASPRRRPTDAPARLRSPGHRATPVPRRPLRRRRAVLLRNRRGGAGGAQGACAPRVVAAAYSALSPPAQAPFAEMHAIVAALRAHDVQPALDWARDNREALSRAAEAGTGSSMEWQLHRLRFLTLLRQVRAVGSVHARGALLTSDLHAQENRTAALKYARENFGRFSAGAQVRSCVRPTMPPC